MKRWFRSFLLILVPSLSLTGCATHMDGVMVPKPEGIDKSRVVAMLSVTTRAPSQNSGIMFSEKRSIKISYADIGIAIPQGHKAGEVEWPIKGDPKSDKYFTTAWANIIDDSGFRKNLAGKLAQHKNGHVIVFVHGYNNRFEDAVYRLAQITFDSGIKSVPVLFTWPSQGKLLGYAYDRESATYSRDGLEGLLQQLSQNPAVKDITVMAHSMGNMVALEALRQMAVRNRIVSPKIRNVILAAPDVDLDVAHNLIMGMGEKRPHITLFTSQDDVALKFSSRISGSTNRLGAIDATKEPYASAFNKQNINVFDLTALKGGDPLNHNKFASSPEVVRLIGTRIASGQNIGSEGGAGLGDRLGLVVTGAVSTAGNAAVVVLSAPISVIDRKTRHNMSERIETIVPFKSSEEQGLAE